MTGDAWLTLVVVVAMLATLAWDRWPPAGVVFGATSLLLLLGVLEPETAFAGFGNPAPLTVATLYILARGAQKTSMLSVITARLLGAGDGRTGLSRLLVPVAGVSAFFPNTPLVAMLMPDVLAWCRSRGRSPSRYLMPLSFAALLGGVVTLLGTSTNLVVSGLLQQFDGEGFAVFELAPVGLPVALIGLVVLLTVSVRLVPERLTPREVAEQSPREFSLAMTVEPGGPLDGTSVAEAGLRDLQGVFLVQIERSADGAVVSPVAPDRRLSGGDRLTFVGNVDDVVDLQRIRGLRSAEHDQMQGLDTARHTFYEAVVSPNSPLAGRTARDVEFRGHYQAAVVAIHRSGNRLTGKLGEIEFRHGDTLLLLAGDDFRERYQHTGDFLLVARLGGPAPAATARAPLVALVTAAVIVAAAANVVSLLEASLVGAGVLIASRTLTFAEARESIDLDVVVLIAAALGLGVAMESTGLAQQIADLLTGAFDSFGVYGVVFGIVAATAALTELVTNNAAAAVMFPIAMAAAGPAELDPRVMAVAIAVVASASFITPIGYQTNTMVYGPGGYRFFDYTRVGAPLTAVVLIVTTVATVLVGRV